MSRYFFQNWVTSANDEDFELSVRRLGSVFYIRYSPRNVKASSLFTRYRKLLNGVDIGDRSAVDQIVKPFECQIESLVAPLDQGYLVSDYLYPRYFVLEATAGPEDTTITPQCKTLEVPLPGDDIHQHPELKDILNWVAKENIYPSNHIRLPPPPEQDTRLSGPGKVLVDGKPYFFKRWCSFGPGATFTELRTYKKIQAAFTSGRIQPDLRISRLHGIVVDGSRLVGVLLTFIETNKPSRMGTLFSRVYGGECSPEKRSRWACDVDAIVAGLHTAGVVWGDAKPHNILVDKDDNIWIIDFGGSYTEGWVDEENADTMKGDWQGVERIKDFLQRRADACHQQSV